jgi:biopolymer transport protein ExbD
MAGGGTDKGPILGINVTPLVDVVLVLLVIFMVAAPVLEKRKLDVTIPKASNSVVNKDQPLEVFVTADKKIYFMGDARTEAELLLMLAAMGKENDDLSIAVSADEAVPYGEVVRVLDKVKDAAVAKVTLAVRPKK